MTDYLTVVVFSWSCSSWPRAAALLSPTFQQATLGFILHHGSGRIRCKPGQCPLGQVWNVSSAPPDSLLAAHTSTVQCVLRIYLPVCRYRTVANNSYVDEGLFGSSKSPSPTKGSPQVGTCTAHQYCWQPDTGPGCCPALQGPSHKQFSVPCSVPDVHSSAATCQRGAAL